MSNIFDIAERGSYAFQMYAASELSNAVRTRRTDMGLTQADVSRLSGLSRATINQLENGTIKDLSFTRTAALLNSLGLSVSISAPHRKERSGKSRPALEQAALSASVSYKSPLPVQILEEAVAHRQLQARYAPHLNAFLEDASVQLIADVVEEVHQRHSVDRPTLWANMRSLAREFGSRRDLWN